jgi:3'-5' exoribonuclease
MHMTDEHDLISSFFSVPASLKDHHAYICGLMVHTVEAMEMGLQISKSPCFKGEVDKSVLIFGLFLHDIGKTLCYTVDGFDLGMTDRCVTIGHANLGYELLLRKSYSFGIFPNELRDKLGNIILSHHSKSKVAPRSAEAEIVKNLDSLSAGRGNMEVCYE